MDAKKIHSIIEEKNEKAERNALICAEGVINAIIENQKVIATATVHIAELRKKLVEITAEQIDPLTVLGD